MPGGPQTAEPWLVGVGCADVTGEPWGAGMMGDGMHPSPFGLVYLAVDEPKG